MPRRNNEQRDQDELIRMGACRAKRHKMLKKWCKGVKGRSHHFAEPLLAATLHAELSTGLILERDLYNLARQGTISYGDLYYIQHRFDVQLVCEVCGRTDTAKRQIWTNRKDYWEIEYHRKRLAEWRSHWRSYRAIPMFWDTKVNAEMLLPRNMLHS